MATSTQSNKSGLRKSVETERLRSLLRYSPVTGLFTWRVDRKNGQIRAGALAGSPCPQGYVKISIDRFLYPAQRLAWQYVHGDIPSHLDVDHIDRVRSHNWISNLRLATNSQNQANTLKRRNNTSGFKGVTWHQRDRRWRAVIRCKGKRLFLGGFKTPEEAHAAYTAKAVELFGEFALTS